MSDIVLSSGIRNNLLALQNTSELMGATQNRLATGKKVNSALDNPLNFFVAAGFSARANDLSRLLDSIGLSVKTLEAANNGITSILKLVETAQATCRQARQSASTTAKIASTQALGTTGAATPLVGGTAAPSTFDVGDTVNITVGGIGPVSIAIAAGETMQTFMDKINTNTTLNPTGTTNVRAYLNDGGNLVMDAVAGGALTIGVTNAGAGTTANTVNDLFGTAIGPGLATTGVIPATVNPTRATFSKQYDELLTQIDQLAKDAGFNGINLLNGDSLKVEFNEEATSSLTLFGVYMSSGGLGVNGSLRSFQADTDIDSALAELKVATNALRAQASTFGANLTVVQTRQDFTKRSMITLNDGADLLTLADQNEEGASLLALQTRQQLSTNSLSLASQADKNVLSLFR
jgi:flagellin